MTAKPPNEAAAYGDQYLYKIREAAPKLSLSRSAAYNEVRAGRLRTVWRGKTKLVPAAALTEYVTLLETETNDRGIV